MIKARYIGVECELQSGKVYPIKTRCTGNKLVVSVRAYKFEYKQRTPRGVRYRALCKYTTSDRG